jgi:UDP-glucose 4-epimerase
VRDLAGARVFVTGGAGFVGSHVVDALVREGAKVVVYDNFRRGRLGNLEWAAAHGDVEVIEGDITDMSHLARSIAGCDLVSHQASLWLWECENDPRQALETNIVGTFNLLEASAEAAVDKVVLASSSSVYGEPSHLPTDEEHPFNNDFFYGATKVADEQLARAFHRKFGVRYICLRYLNVYGPRQDYRSAYVSVITNFINRVADGEPPIIFGDGSETLDLIFVEDVARVNLLALKSDLENDILNVASGRETTLRELAQTIIEVMGSDLVPTVENRERGLVVRRWGSTERAEQRLGFRSTVELREGLERLIAWRRDDMRRRDGRELD